MEYFEMKSSDGLMLSAYKFIPSDIKSTLLIVHGSIEHAKRYSDIAEFLCDHGIAVYTFDQRGHGRTAKEDDNVAYFSDKDDGWYQSVEDIDLFIEMIKKEHPGKSIDILGHSMGSFLTRTYIALYPDKIDHVILSGTADIEKNLLSVGRALCNFYVKIFGRKFRSKIIHNLIYGTLNNQIVNPRTHCDFISKDKKIVDAYIKDDRCGNLVTCEYAREMLNGIHFISQQSTYEKVNKNLPIFIISGDEDPVAYKNHADLNRTINGYKKANIVNLKVKIYDDMRHEIINEIDRLTVYQDILDFIS